MKPNTSKGVANVEGMSSHLTFKGHTKGVGDSNNGEEGRGTVTQLSIDIEGAQ